MALRFLDSFDHYVTADLAEKYDLTAGSTAPSIQGTSRAGTALSCTDGNTPALVRKVLTSKDTWIVGMGIRISTYSASDKPLFRWMDVAGTTQFTLNYRTGTGLLYVVSQFGTSGNSSVAINQATWYFLELKVVFSNTGSYELRLNGASVLSATGVDTTISGNQSAAMFELTSGSSAGTSTARQFDDLYVFDGDASGITGAPNNDFIGDSRVEVVYPNANGTTSNMVGSDGNSTDNYLLVDETAPNDDTDYVVTSTVGDKDTYNYGSLAVASADVYGIQLMPSIRKATPGTRQVASISRLSSTEVDSANKTVTEAYTYYPDVRNGDPSGNQWTVSNVNAMEAGVKVTV